MLSRSLNRLNYVALFHILLLLIFDSTTCCLRDHEMPSTDTAYARMRSKWMWMKFYKATQKKELQLDRGLWREHSNENEFICRKISLHDSIIIASIRVRAWWGFVSNEFIINIESFIGFTATHCLVRFQWTRWTGRRVLGFGSCVRTIRRHWISVRTHHRIVGVVLEIRIVSFVRTITRVGRWWISNDFR